MTDFQMITIVATIVALVLNFFALLFAGYQTLVSRRALVAANQGIADARRSRQLDLLPQANWITQILGSLERWKDQLQSACDQLEEALRHKDGAVLKRISENTRGSAEGLVDRFFYEHAPDWLREVLMSGARYYYDAVAAMIHLWKIETGEPNFGLAESMVNVQKRSIAHISDLIEYLEGLVPESYLAAPARLADDRYLSRP